MSRGDVVLLVLWCLALLVVGRAFEFSTLAIVSGMLGGGVAFAIRLWLARRTFRR